MVAGFSGFILVFGLGLIVSATWHYVGYEIREHLYEYQIQAGIHPISVWATHYLFDLAVNTTMLIIFIQVAMKDSEKEVIDMYMWSGFLAMMGYTWIQYIVIYYFKLDRLIENVLSWSSIVMLCFLTVEFVGASKGFTDMDPIGYSDVKKWEQGGLWSISLILTYLMPALQFFWGYSHALSIHTAESNPDDVDSSFLHYKDWYWSWRFFWAWLASMFWMCVFMGLQLYDTYKKDPTKAPYTEQKSIPDDVLKEKDIAAKFGRGDISREQFPAIVADNLTKVFDKLGVAFTAVDGLSFTVAKGECFGLLGKNGAGKSTAMNMLTTLLKSSSGDPYLNGSNNVTDMRNILGSCPQHDPLWKKLTVWQHLLFFGLIKGVKIGDIQEEIERICVALTLDPYYDRASGSLSGGNKRKLILATSLIGASEIVFLDEPSSGVDPFARKCMMDAIIKYNETRAIVLTTHMMEEADVLCEKVGIMVNSGNGGDFKCVNTINGLVNQFGGGYQIEVSLTGLDYDEIIILKSFLTENMKDIVLSEEDQLVLAYQIPSTSNKLSSVFATAQKMYERWNCDYVLSQMTMDQLFLQITSDQRPEDEDDEHARSGGGHDDYCCLVFVVVKVDLLWKAETFT
eukprot:UN34652